MLAVGHHEDGALDAAEELFYHDAAAGIAKHTAEHLFQFLLGFVEGGQDEYALTSTETVGLQYVGGFERLQEGESFLHVLAVEGLVAGCGDVVALHESLGKVLGAFEHGTGL